MTETEFIEALRGLPLHPGAHGLADDVAVIGDLVLTHDMIVEGVHFLASDPPDSVGWKLAAVNLSDLAAAGARPEGVLLGFSLGTDAWDRAFVDGLGAALRRFDCPLIGGDTVRGAASGSRSFGLTAIGRSARVPGRRGAQAGDALYVTGTIGDAGAGLTIARGAGGPETLRDRYRRPLPRLAEGQALAPIASAMLDVSDGVLIDAQRMAVASGVGVAIDLAAVPLSADLIAFAGDRQDARLTAACAGDDYELLFALPPALVPPVPATRIGAVVPGAGVSLTMAGLPVPLPDRLGYAH